jgi:hypothetical protein
MQIKSITLYNPSGEKRTLSFKLGQVNIITGRSSRGKSAIIEIIEYCLGRSSFKVPEGIIRDAVAWYSLLLQINQTQIFIAKPKPLINKKSQNKVYYESGSEITIPDLVQLVPNSNNEAIVTELSRLIGISPNQTIVEDGNLRNQFEATIKHTSYYLFQKQSIVANKNILFHQQEEQWIPQAIKDTLPYFLGAIQEDRLKLEKELRQANRQLKQAQRKLKEAELIADRTVGIGHNLIIASQQVGLISSDFVAKDNNDILNALRKTIAWTPDKIPLTGNDQFSRLQAEREELLQDFKNKHEKIIATQMYLKKESDYSSEAHHQVLRLKSINLFKQDNKDSADECPLCKSNLKKPIPTISEIRGSLSDLSNSLKKVQVAQPQLFNHIQELKEQLEETRQQLQEKELTLQALTAEQEVAQRTQDTNIRIAQIVGQIRLYLQTVKFTDEDSQANSEISYLQRVVDNYEAQLDISEVESILTSMLNRIGQQMSEWAAQLNIEHSDSPYRFDIKKLTVIADRPERPIPMEVIGGGENWLGCHLITLLSLHKHFIERDRPVPHFLILDQPTQVYFPHEEEYINLQEGTPTDETAISSTDREAVERMFNFLFDVCEELSPKLQIIVMEHANLAGNEKFQNALIEEPWTDSKALIPEDWLSK